MAQKVQFVQARLNSWQLQRFERFFIHFGSQRSDEIRWIPAPGAQDTLFLNIVYALLRHRDWYDTHVFRALMVEYLQRDHNVPAGVGRLLISGMIEECAALGIRRDRTLCIDDREFLTYVCAQVGVINSDIDLECEIGLGSALIAKLRDALKVIDDGRVDCFIPEYDAMLASIVIELMHKVKASPYYLDELRLKYLLLGTLGDSSVPWVFEEALPDLLSTLVDIGLKVAVSPDAEIKLSPLQSAGLIHAVQKGNKSKAKDWNLTDLGIAVGTRFFLQGFGVQYGQSIEQFMQLPQQWQVALIANHQFTTIGFLLDLLTTQIQKAAPSLIEHSVKRMADSSAGGIDHEMLNKLLDGASMPWQKAAILRALSDVSPSDALAEVVADSLVGMTGGSVVEAAGSLLEKWGRPL